MEDPSVIKRTHKMPMTRSAGVLALDMTNFATLSDANSLPREGDREAFYGSSVPPRSCSAASSLCSTAWDVANADSVQGMA